MAGGNLHLPRLGTRGVVEPTSKVKREPKRYAVADRRAERCGPAVESLRSLLACEPLDVSDCSVAVRAVGDLAPGTCRFPTGPMEHLTYCGAPATVAAAGVLTYCAACARRRWFDLDAWRREHAAVG